LNNGRVGNEDYPEFIRCFFVQRRNDPRKETFLQMLKDTFCPTLTKTSFVTIITLIESAVFLAVTTASFFLDGGLENLYFLGANPKIVLELDRNPAKIVH